MADDVNAPKKYPRTVFDESDKPRCRAIVPPTPGGWTEPVIHEWELRAETWTDWHPHTEYNYVVEGQLFVEADGVTVEATAGDVVRVPKATAGRYWAPTYARLIAIYGPSDGAASQVIEYGRLSPAGA